MILVSREQNGYGEPICTMLDAKLEPFGAFMTWLDSVPCGTMLTMYNPEGYTSADLSVCTLEGASKGWYTQVSSVLEAQNER